MGKRSCTSNPSVIELEHEEGVGLRSSKRRPPQVIASNTGAAMSLLALRTELPAFSEEAFPLSKPLFPLHPQRQAKAMKYSVSSITDDEDEDETNKVVASKKRSDVFHVGPSLTQLALRKPVFCAADTRRREAPNHRNGRPLPPTPFGRPLPPAPLLPSLIMFRRVIPTTNKS
jgi:hypothetical protein